MYNHESKFDHNAQQISDRQSMRPNDRDTLYHADRIMFKIIFDYIIIIIIIINNTILSKSALVKLDMPQNTVSSLRLDSTFSKNFSTGRKLHNEGFLTELAQMVADIPYKDDSPSKEHMPV